MATSSIHISLPPRNEPTQAAHRPVGLLPALVARVAPQPQAAGGLFSAKPAHVQHQTAATAPPCSGLRRIRSPRALARTTVSDHPARSSHRGGHGEHNRGVAGYGRTRKGGTAARRGAGTSADLCLGTRLGSRWCAPGWRWMRSRAPPHARRCRRLRAGNVVSAASLSSLGSGQVLLGRRASVALAVE